MAIIFLNSIKQLMFVMVKCGVLFEVRTEFLDVIQTSFGFKGLKGLYYWDPFDDFRHSFRHVKNEVYV
jgi:hypothetical protein